MRLRKYIIYYNTTCTVYAVHIVGVTCDILIDARVNRFVYPAGYDQGTPGNVAGQHAERGYIQHRDNGHQPARRVVRGVQRRGGVAYQNPVLRPGQARVVHKERLSVGDGQASHGIQRYPECA